MFNRADKVIAKLKKKREDDEKEEEEREDKGGGVEIEGLATEGKETDESDDE